MKRFLAIALCLCLTIGAMSVMAMATTGGTTTGGTTTGGTTTGGATTGGTTTGGSTTGGSTTGGSTTGGSTTGGSTTGGTTTGSGETGGGEAGGTGTGAGGGTVSGGSAADESTVNVDDFADVNETAYYYSALVWAVENGITNGTTETTFSPNAGCTRGQMVSFLWRAAGCPEPKSTSHNFTDIDENAHYFKALLWAIEEGITNGTTATTFSPSKICTRAQMAAFLYRHAGSPVNDGDHSFTDVNDNAYYNDAVAWALDTGITNGTTTTTYSPSNNCTRAQMVTFLYRYFAE